MKKFLIIFSAIFFIGIVPGEGVGFRGIPVVSNMFLNSTAEAAVKKKLKRRFSKRKRINKKRSYIKRSHKKRRRYIRNRFQRRFARRMFRRIVFRLIFR